MNARSHFDMRARFLCLNSFRLETVRFLLLLVFAVSLQCQAHDAVQSAAEYDYPPLSIVLENGYASGFSVELLRATLAVTGHEVRFKNGSWKEIKADLEHGRIDALPLVGRTPEREAYFDFTIPYLRLYGAVFVREGSDHKRVDDLRNRLVGVMQGDNAEEYALRHSITEHLISTATYTEAFNRLAAGELDAVIAQRLMGLTLINQLELDEDLVVMSSLDDFTQEFTFAVHKGDKELLSILNEGLAIVSTNGTYDRLYNQWLGVLTEEHLSSLRFWRQLAYGAGAAGLVLAVMMVLIHLRSHRNLVRSEKESRDNRLRLEQLVRAGNVGLWDWDLETNQVFYSAEWKHQIGYEDDEISSDLSEFKNRLHPDELDTVMEVVSNYLEKLEGDYENEFRFRHKNGEYRWILAQGALIRDQKGQPIRMLGSHLDITSRKMMEKALSHSESRFRTLANNIPGATYRCLMDEHWTMKFVSEGITSLSGYPANEFIKNEVRSFASIIHPDDVDHVATTVGQALTHNHSYSIEYRILHADGQTKWVFEQGQGIHGDSGELLYLDGVIIDVTSRKEAEQKLKLSSNVFTHTSEGIIITDADGSILDVNQAFTSITGYTTDEVIGQNPSLLKSGRHDEQFYISMWDELKTKGYWRNEIWNRRKNGSVYPEVLNINCVRDDEGNIINYIGVFADVTEQKMQEFRLEHMAHFDALTNLPNRVLLMDRLTQEMSRISRLHGNLAVVYIDLDGFNQINEAYGKELGDTVLQRTARRLRETMRKGDTLGRIGGDEFVILMVDLEKKSQASQLLDRLLVATSQPFEIDDKKVEITVSLGVTYYPQREELEADQLLRQADLAMYRAKLAGKNRYQYFDPEEDRSIRGRHESLEHVRAALMNNEFVLFYQPKVNMRSGELIGVEALIRWQYPGRGLLMPGEFLPFIEGDAESSAIDEWVISRVLAQISEWLQQGKRIPVSINIGSLLLQQPDFVEILESKLNAYPDVDHELIELEVLETSTIKDIDHVSDVIRQCRRIGVMFSLDDFGTGYSSLTYLKRLPVRTLKVDQSFIRDMLHDPDDLAILEGVLALSSAFQHSIIAEGVESVEHGELLLKLGCELGQGYGIAKPMSASALLDWMDRWQTYEQWRQIKPVPQEDLPIIRAGVEHRTWISELKDYVNGERPFPPELHADQCRFSGWINGQGKRAYQGLDAYEHIVDLHDRTHRIGYSICKDMERAQKNLAKEQLNELEKVSVPLLEFMDELMKVGSSKKMFKSIH